MSSKQRRRRSKKTITAPVKCLIKSFGQTLLRTNNAIDCIDGRLHVNFALLIPQPAYLDGNGWNSRLAEQIYNLRIHLDINNCFTEM